MNAIRSRKERDQLQQGHGLQKIGDRALRMMQAGRNVHELCRETGFTYREMRTTLLDAKRREMNNEH